MSVLVAIARHTLLDALRERAFFALAVFAALMLIASRVLGPLAMGETRRVTLDLGLGLMSLFGFLLVLFIGTRMVQKEIERKTILVLLAKPIRRGEFVVGKFIGLIGVLAISIGGMLAVLAAVMFAAGFAVDGSLLVAGYYAWCELVIVAALTMLLTAFTSPVLATFFLLGLFIAGHLSTSLLDAARLVADPLCAALLRGFFVALPRLDLYSYTLEVVHGVPASVAQLAWSTLYALLYACGALFLSMLIFSRREFS